MAHFLLFFQFLGCHNRARPSLIHYTGLTVTEALVLQLQLLRAGSRLPHDEIVSTVSDIIKKVGSFFKTFNHAPASQPRTQRSWGWPHVVCLERQSVLLDPCPVLFLVHALYLMLCTGGHDTRHALCREGKAWAGRLTMPAPIHCVQVDMASYASVAPGLEDGPQNRGRLSGGQRKHLAVALELLRQPQ